MKRRNHALRISFIIPPLLVTCVGCQMSHNSTSGACTTAGIPVSIGSTYAGTYCQTLGTGQNQLCLDNMALNFSARGPDQNGATAPGTIQDFGAAFSCLSSIPKKMTASALTVLAQQGNGYMAQFPNGAQYRFIAGAYNNQGAMSVNYTSP